MCSLYVFILTEVKNRKRRVIHDITSLVNKFKNDFVNFTSFMEIFEEKSTKTQRYIEI